MKALRQALREVDEYWFSYGSPTPLGLVRILVGLAAFLSLLITAIQFDDWFTERGFVPQEMAKWYMAPTGREVSLFGHAFLLPFEVPRLNLLSQVTDARVTALFYALLILASITTTLGLWTRLSAVVLAVGMVSLHHRNALILHGGDTLLRLAVMYLALAPCGKACSLDRLIGLWKGRIGPEPPEVSVWPQRLITFNVALVYFTTVWHKWGGTTWRDGTAAWYPARLNEFKRFPVPDFVNQMPFVKVATYGTLLTELAMATLVFYKPWRKWVLLAGLGMHGYIEYSMNIPLFSFTICSLYVAFYDGEEIAAWAKGLGRRLARYRMAVRLPVGHRLRPGPAAALDAVDPLDLVEFEPGEAGWQGVGSDAKPKPPFWCSLVRSAGAWPLIVVPGLWKRVLKRAAEPTLLPSANSKTRQAEAVGG